MKKFDLIKCDIENIISQFSGEVGIIINVNGETLFSKNKDKIFQSASLIKLFILEALLEKVSQNKLSYDDKKNIDSLDKVPGFGVLKVLDYYLNFIEKKGYYDTQLQRKMYDSIAKERGLDNFTSAQDTLKVLENLCGNEIALYMLKNQLCNSKIPLYFFRKVEVAHKTGDLTNIEHDAGRIFFKNNFVDLIILTEGENKEAVLLNNRLGEYIYENFKDY